MEYAYKDDLIGIYPLTVKFNVRKLREGVYEIALVGVIGEFSIQISPILEDNRTNPVSMMLLMLNAGLSRSPYSPVSEYTLSGGRRGDTGSWILIVTPNNSENSFHYGVSAKNYWLDVRGYARSKTRITEREITKWMTEGIEVVKDFLP